MRQLVCMMSSRHLVCRTCVRQLAAALSTTRGARPLALQRRRYPSSRQLVRLLGAGSVTFVQWRSPRHRARLVILDGTLA